MSETRYFCAFSTRTFSTYSTQERIVLLQFDIAKNFCTLVFKKSFMHFSPADIHNYLKNFSSKWTENETLFYCKNYDFVPFTLPSRYWPFLTVPGRYWSFGQERLLRKTVTEAQNRSRDGNGMVTWTEQNHNFYCKLIRLIFG